VLTVAHRAGNDLTALASAAAAGVDLVEADVHRFRGRLEVRHWKSLGPRLLWERWILVRRRSVPLVDLADVLAAAGRHGTGVMLDLKGVHPALAPALAARLRDMPPGPAVVVCSRHWWMLRAFAGDPRVRLALSAGSRYQLRRLRRRLRRAGADAVCVHRRLLTQAVVHELHRSVPYVLTWPVDHPDDLAAARSLGVSGVIGKDPAVLRG